MSRLVESRSKELVRHELERPAEWGLVVISAGNVDEVGRALLAARLVVQADCLTVSDPLILAKG